MNNQEKTVFIKDRLSSKDLLVQAAEESAEFSAAVLKYVRAKDGNNPTAKTEEEIINAVLEEMTDLQLCLDVLGRSYIDSKIYNTKLERWYRRLKGELF